MNRKTIEENDVEIILLDKVEKLGDVGDVVKTRPGYARNYLIPFGKAEPATAENVARIERHKAELERQMQEERAKAEERAAKIKDAAVVVSVEVGAEGRVFGSVGTAEIAAAVSQACGVDVAKSEVRLPDGVFRETGEYPVELHLHADVNAVVTITIAGKE